MSDSTTTVTCPNCGAPMSQLPDGTCRWCHAVVKQSSNVYFARAALFTQLGELVRNGWSLTAAPGSRHAIPWTMGTQLLSPAKEILAVLADGLAQPGMATIAGKHELDHCFCLLINNVISAGIEVNDDEGPGAYLQVCDLLDALAGVDDTDPTWAQRARECAAHARQEFGDEWRNVTDGDAPDVFQADLLAWIARRLKHESGRHFWQR